MNAEMNAMIDLAAAEGKWLHCGYQDIWFSPAGLRKAQAAGKFCWGPINWSLRDPAEQLQEAERRVQQAEAERDRIVARIVEG